MALDLGNPLVNIYLNTILISLSHIEVGREVIDALVAAKKHDIVVFSRTVTDEPKVCGSFCLLTCSTARHRQRRSRSYKVYCGLWGQKNIDRSSPRNSYPLVFHSARGRSRKYGRKESDWCFCCSWRETLCTKSMGKVYNIHRCDQNEIWPIQSASTVDMSWWAGKDKAKEYLEKVNANGKVKTPLRAYFLLGL